VVVRTALLYRLLYVVAGARYGGRWSDVGESRRQWTTSTDLVILLTMTTLSLADAKAHLSRLVARVSGQHERIYVTVHGKPSAVLLATEDLESLEETIEILADADTMRRLHQSDAELARGEGETLEDLDAAMQRRRATT
jgi:antitoxin YefM